MNKRIEDLMYHAGLTAQGCWDEMDEYDRKAIEKFAELIIRECLSVTKKQYNETLPWGGVEDTIKEHFGVEE